MPNEALNPDVQTVQIKDFSPGIFRYGLGTLPVSFSPQAPLGSASYAVRCVNQPGIGLVPFYSYSTELVMATNANSPGSVPWTYTTIGSFGVLGGIDPFANTGAFGFTDMFVISLVGADAANTWNVGYVMLPTSTFTFTQTRAWAISQALTPLPSQFYGTSFDQSIYTAGDPILVCCVPSGNTYIIPDPTGTNLTAFIVVDSEPLDLIFALAHSQRILPFYTGNNQMGQGGSLIGTWYTISEYARPTDPPLSLTLVGVGSENFYGQENTSQYGAWGSVSTGELVLIHQSGQAEIVSGDALAPSSIIKLPAVRGTGQVVQKATECDAGMVYVSQSAGVWAWNGGNTSAKVSNQIPDDACIRADMLSYFTAAPQTKQWAGLNTQHDKLDQFVFFPNNYVFDSTNNSWWQCEDTSIMNFSVFQRSQAVATSMYAMQSLPDVGSSPATYTMYRFVTTARASSYAWTSNPIEVTTDSLVSLQRIEVVASNPTATSCTIKVQPTVPPGQISNTLNQNSTQSFTFTIPAGAIAYRGSVAFGYSDYNIMIAVTATNSNGSNAAPILHELNMTFATTETSGVQ